MGQGIGLGWLEFGVAMGVFMVSHRIPAALRLKGSLENILGPRGYVAVFSLISVLLLFWVIGAATRAPVVPLWSQSEAARWAVNIALPLAILLGSFGVGAPNPFAFEGRAAGFDPDNPGIVGLTRQPLLWALLLWSAAHLWANGDLAHVILFGVFAVFSAIGMLIVERRSQRMIGKENWLRLTRCTGLLPFTALLQGKWWPRGLPPLNRAVIALLIWGALIALHPVFIGAFPLP